MRLTFDFYGDTQVDRTLDRFTEHVDDATDAWQAMADDFQRIERDQFRTEGRHGSGQAGWAPLSPSYARWKATHYPGKPILQRDGDLVRSLTERPFGVEVILPHYMAVGSDVDHGRFHQKPGHGSHLPRRRPIEFTEADRRRWVKIMQTFLVYGNVKVGPRGGISHHGIGPTVDASTLPPFRL